MPKKDLLIPESQSPRRSINISKPRMASFDSKSSSRENKTMLRIGSSLSVKSHLSKGSKESKASSSHRSSKSRRSNVSKRSKVSQRSRLNNKNSGTKEKLKKKKPSMANRFGAAIRKQLLARQQSRLYNK